MTSEYHTPIGFGAAADSATVNAPLAELDFTLLKAPLLQKRQGGSATSWASPGTTDYTPSNLLTQVGAKTVSFGASDTRVALDITFPQAFSYTPLVFTSIRYDTATIAVYYAQIEYVDDDELSLNIVRSGTGDDEVTLVINWLAIGPA